MTTLPSRVARWAVAPASADESVTLSGSLLNIVRTLWLAVAAASLLVWMVETPALYSSALRLHNTNGIFTLTTETWRVGLNAAGLSPALYAAISIAALYVMTATMFLTGVVIFQRRSRELIALLVSYTFIGLGPGIINAYAGGPAFIHAHPELNLPLQVYSNLTNFSYYGLFVIPLLFPDGRFVPRWLIWPFAALVAIALLPVPPAQWLQGPVLLLTVAAVLLSPIYRYRRVSTPEQREQTKWVLFGLIIALGTFITVNIVQVAVPYLSSTPERSVLFALIAGTIGYVALSYLPISFAVAILRYKLWDIDALINRTLVYVSLTATLAALYIGGVIVLQALFRAMTGQGSELAVAVSTLAIAALFNPWRRRLQIFVDRRFYRHKYDTLRTLSAFQVTLRDQVDMDELSNNVLEVVQNTMQPAAAAFWVRGDPL